MPELPEVQTVLDGFRKAVEGRRIDDLVCFYPGTVIYADGQDFFAQYPIDFHRRGKYMIIGLSGGQSLIIHLRMTGKLVYDPKPLDIHKHERARLVLDGGDAVRFIDIRTFGKIVLCSSNAIYDHLPVLGVEPLEKDFDEKFLQHRIGDKKTPVKSFLLDQSVIAGLGNIYVCEALYRSGISPERAVNTLKKKEIRALVRECKLVLFEALEHNGTSISDFRSIDDKTGEFQNMLRVYQKKQCPHGHEVSIIRQAGRSTFFCRKCQK